SFLGLLLAGSSAKSEAVALCKKAADLLEPLSFDAPELAMRRVAAYAHLARAYSALSDRFAAKDAYRKEIKILEKLAKVHPGNRLYEDSLGREYNGLGVAQMNSGEVEAGIASCKQSLKIKESLAARYPDIAEFKANLARGLNTVAGFVGNLEEA